MEPVYDPHAPKKATNLSVNRDLLGQARELGINLSRLFEEHLAEIVRARRREQWSEENREAIEEYNRRVASRGVFSDGLRRF
ncbi:MAG: type II toxin-antitoxin system CcdA family antitoxin [Thermodesulfobacteriota bacterium]|jgi:antitoxin CcdA